MAVINDYVNSNTLSTTGKLAAAALSVGAEVVHMCQTFEIAAADDNGSVYRLFKALNPDLIPVRIEVRCDAITSGTDFDLGFYLPLEQGGAEIDKDVLMDGQSLASALTTSPADGMQTVDIANRTKRIWELCGHTQDTKKLGYDLALTGNTVGSAAGTVTVNAYFVQG